MLPQYLHALNSLGLGWEGKSKADLRKLVFSDKSDLTTMLQDGLLKVLAGETNISEVMRVIEIDDDQLDAYESFNKSINVEEQLAEMKKDKSEDGGIPKEISDTLVDNQSSNLIDSSTQNEKVNEEQTVTTSTIEENGLETFSF